jgi:hypothetical protein
MSAHEGVHIAAMVRSNNFVRSKNFAIDNTGPIFCDILNHLTLLIALLLRAG